MTPASRWTIAGLLLLHTMDGVAQEGPGRPGPVSEVHPEVALAESAAPPEVGRAATVWVAGPEGYVLARRGTNGFTCLVERSHPRSVEPICYDAEGSETIVPRVLAVAALRAAGADSATVARAVAEGYASGRFRAPRRAGIAYMLSPATTFWNPDTGALEPGTPHLMFYAPYLTNAAIGSTGEPAGPADPARPFVIEEGTPGAWIIVMMPARETGR